MKLILCEKILRIIKARKHLEKTLNLKITNRGKEVTLEGTPEEEYIGEKVIDAIEFGFPISVALEIKTEELIFERINIKEYTNRKDLERIRARIIGAKGKTLKTLSQLSDCYIEIKDNQVGIIGDTEKIQNTQDAILSIIQGSKQGNVYSLLEKRKVLPLEDLGLKE